MFHIFSKDIIRHIYEFDPTYREVFDEVLQTLVTPNMRVLQKFLSSYSDLCKWQVMKQITIERPFYKEEYFETALPNDKKVIYSVVVKEKRIVIFGIHTQMVLCQKHLDNHFL
jgi:hypothetical protein